MMWLFLVVVLAAINSCVSQHNITTTPVLTTPVPTRYQVFGQRHPDYNERRSSWPNKPPLQKIGSNEITSSSEEGLLLHLSLPPPLPNETAPQEALMNKFKKDNPHVSVIWQTTTNINKCPAEFDYEYKTVGGEPLHWPSTKIGESAYSNETCLNSSMQPVMRPCLRDERFGAQWGEPTGECTDQNTSTESTKALLDVLKVKVTSKNAADLTKNLANAIGIAETPCAGDVMLVADSLSKISDVAQALTSKSVTHLAKLMDGVLKASDAPKDSDRRNNDGEATRRILSSLDNILSQMRLDDAEGGIASAFAPRAALLVADVAESHVKGIRAMKGEDDGMFSDIKPLGNDNAILDNSDYEVAARLLDEPTDGRASFVVIGNSRTFPQNNKSEQVRLNSRVVGVTLTGTSSQGRRIQYELKPLTIPNAGFIRKCAYWDLNEGVWSTEGCKLVKKDTETGHDICECTHLTHFGEIIGIGGESIALDVISIAGSVLSLLGLIGIALTAILFKQWRSRLGNKILLHLSGAIGLSMIAFLAIAMGGASGGTGNGGCIFLGILMHYSILAAFCWMLVSASLQLLRFVVVISARPPHFLLKGVLVGWGLPLIPVIGLLIAGPSKMYMTNIDDDGSGKFCYPYGLGLILAVIIPVAVAVVANLIIFCIIVYRVTCGRDKKLQTNVNAISERRMAVRQLRMSILLFFLLGLSWIFGLLALLLPNADVLRTMFSYLFCATATIQGLALFLFFVVWERKTRALWLARLPEGIIQATTSDTTSGITPSTGTMSNTRTDDEVRPLRQRSMNDGGMRHPSTRNTNGVRGPNNRTQL